MGKTADRGSLGIQLPTPKKLSLVFYLHPHPSIVWVSLILVLRQLSYQRQSLLNLHWDADMVSPQQIKRSNCNQQNQAIIKRLQIVVSGKRSIFYLIWSSHCFSTLPLCPTSIYIGHLPHLTVIFRYGLAAFFYVFKINFNSKDPIQKM